MHIVWKEKYLDYKFIKDKKACSDDKRQEEGQNFQGINGMQMCITHCEKDVEGDKLKKLIKIS